MSLLVLVQYEMSFVEILVQVDELDQELDKLLRLFGVINTCFPIIAASKTVGNEVQVIVEQLIKVKQPVDVYRS